VPGPGGRTTHWAGARPGCLALTAINRRADRYGAPLRPGLYAGRRGCVAEDGAEGRGIHAGEVLNPVTCFESDHDSAAPPEGFFIASSHRQGHAACKLPLTGGAQ